MKTKRTIIVIRKFEPLWTAAIIEKRPLTIDLERRVSIP